MYILHSHTKFDKIPDIPQPLSIQFADGKGISSRANKKWRPYSRYNLHSILLLAKRTYFFTKRTLRLCPALSVWVRM